MFVFHYVCHGCHTLFVAYPTLRSTVRGSPFVFLSLSPPLCSLVLICSTFTVVSKS
jgi:hypothetical protein